LLPDRWKAPAMPFAGADVVAMGVPEGPAVGHVLKTFERWWIAHDFPREPSRQQEQLNRLVHEALG
jgi:poly(A) polymerase